MNERLKQIMLERGLHKHISEDCQHRIEMIYEIVVRECIEICERGTSTQTTSAGAASLIRQHFQIK